MSKVIDEKIVSMQFDNRQFEKNVDSTLRYLKDLERGLRLDGATSGLDNLGTATKNTELNFRNLEATACSAGFRIKDVWIKTMSYLERNIAQPLADNITRTAKALTIDPVKTGLTEYETKLNAIQTILANTESKGTTLDDVNKALAELNTYADKTIYNFAQMTKNIGTFTAAGVDLDTSVSAIQGIANLAAVSGSTSQQASTAMYQLSQALASGTVKLMDWNSVVNAGMGGEVFQNALKDTARVHGVAIDDIIEKQGSFRESLSEGWLTSEILTETLMKFTMTTEDLTDAQIAQNRAMLAAKGYTEKQIDEIFKLGTMATNAATEVKTFTQLLDTLQETAQSGWSQTWEIVVGDFNSAKTLWSGLYKSIGGFIDKVSEARNLMLKKSLGSGWSNFLDLGIFDEKGYTNWLSDISGVDFKELTKDGKAFEDVLRESMKNGKIDAEDLFKAMNSLVLQYENNIEALGKNGYTEEQLAKLRELTEAFRSGELSIDEYYKKIERVAGRNLLIESFKNVADYIKQIIAPIKEAWNNIFPSTDKAEKLYSVLEKIHSFTSKLKVSDDTADKLRRTFEGLFSILKILKMAFQSVMTIAGKFAPVFRVVGKAVLTVTAYLGDFFTWLAKTLEETNTFKEFVAAVVAGMGKVGQAFTKAWENVKSWDLGWLTDIFNFLGATLKETWSIIKEICSKIGAAFKDTFNGEGVLTVISFSEIIQTLFAGGFFLLIKKFIDQFKQIKTEAISTFKDTLNELKESLFGMEESALKIQVFKTLATSIAILVAALVVLTLIDYKKLWSGVAALSVIIAMLLSSFEFIANTDVGGKDGAKTLVKTVKTLIPIAVALLIVAVAMKKLASLGWEGMGIGLISMVASLSTLIGCIWLLKAMKIDQVKTKTINKLLTFSLILYSVGGALKILGSLSWKQMGIGLISMTTALSTLIGCMWLMNKLKTQDTKGVVKLLGLTIVLYSLAGLLKLFSTINLVEATVALTTMTKALGVLLGSMWLMNLFKTQETKGVTKLLGLTVILYALAGVLKLFGMIELEEANKALTTMTKALGVLLGCLWLVNKFKIKDAKGMANIAILAGTLIIVAGVIKKLGAMSWKEISVGLVGMSTALAALVGALAIMSALPASKNSSISTAASLVILAIALKVLVPTLKELGSMNTPTLAKGLIAIASALAVFGLASAIFGKYSIAMMAFGKSLMYMGVGCAAAGAGIYLLSAGLSMLIPLLVSGGPAVVSAIQAMAVGLIELIPLLMTKIGEGIVAICGVLVNSATTIGQALVTLFLAGLNALVQIVPELAEGFVTIIIGILEVAAQNAPAFVGYILDIIVTVLSGLAERIPEISEKLAEIIMGVFIGTAEALKNADTEALAEGIKAVGFLTGLMAALSLVTAFIPAAMLGVVGMGVVIAELALVLAAIGALAKIDGLQDLISGGSGLLQAIGNAIGNFIGGILGGIGEGVTGSLPAMATNLSNFMKNLQPFLDGIKSLDSSMLENGKTLASLILTITAANVLERLTAWMSGGTDMAEFGAQLGAFGKGIKDFANEVAGIDCETVKAAAEAGKNLGEMARAIPTSGGLWDLLAGKNDLSGFGGQMKHFGQGVKDFANEVTGVDGGKVKMAAEAGKALGQMAKEIPTSGGLWDLLAGSNDLVTFSEHIKSFGLAIKNFSDTSAKISTDNVNKGVKAGHDLANMAKAIPTTGGLLQVFTGTKNLKKFSDGLGIFASAIVNFANEMAKVGDVSVVVNKVTSLNAALMSFSIDGIKAFTNSFSETKPKVSKLITEMLNAAIKVIKNNENSFANAIKNLINKMVSAIRNNKHYIVDAFDTAIDESVRAIKADNNYNEFYNAGKNFVRGFSSGISEHSSLASISAGLMAKAAAKAAAKELDEHSPSKVGYGIGDYFGVAFVNGINDNVSGAFNVASDLASSAKDGLSNVLTKICSFIENGIDTQPTIRPILDLSDVQSKLGTMNGMLATSPSVGVLARVDSISSTMNKNQNGGNSDVVSAIENLKDTMKSNSNNTYNINGVTYNDGSDVQEAIETIVRAIIRERRS